jgi:hypothetical protein
VHEQGRLSDPRFAANQGEATARGLPDARERVCKRRELVTALNEAQGFNGIRFRYERHQSIMVPTPSRRN